MHNGLSWFCHNSQPQSPILFEIFFTIYICWILAYLLQENFLHNFQVDYFVICFLEVYHAKPSSILNPKSNPLSRMGFLKCYAPSFLLSRTNQIPNEVIAVINESLQGLYSLSRIEKTGLGVALVSYGGTKRRTQQTY